MKNITKREQRQLLQHELLDRIVLIRTIFEESIAGHQFAERHQEHIDDASAVLQTLETSILRDKLKETE